MVWLRGHAGSGDVLANDQMADAGIWAPFKAGVPVLVTRSGALPPEAPVVLDNIAHLEASPEAAAAACALHVRYVYYGARTVHEVYGRPERLLRHFPPVDDLRKSTALSEVFTAGKTSIFRVNLPCYA